MTSGSHATPARGRWRLVTPLLVMGSGLLFSISAVNGEGGDLRPERYVDLASVVNLENAQAQRLQDRVNSTRAEVDALARGVDDAELRALRERARAARLSAGLTTVTGPAVRVSMSDAPPEIINDSTLDGNLLVVHQQYVQAVVNAMWRGGANAVMIQGQRVVSTTGIKCTGNTIRIGGIAYGQPFVVESVGNQDRVLAALYSDETVQLYRQLADNPLIQLGWEMTTPGTLTAPPYDGPIGATLATPLRG